MWSFQLYGVIFSIWTFLCYTKHLIYLDILYIKHHIDLDCIILLKHPSTIILKNENTVLDNTHTLCYPTHYENQRLYFNKILIDIIVYFLSFKENYKNCSLTFGSGGL